MTSVTVRANWPAKMSHSPHGECDIDAKRTDEGPGFEQPASGGDCIGSSGRVMGVSTRHARRITTAYREEGAAALAHGHRGRKPVNATPEAVIADVVRLASTRYQGANHTHLSELLSERESIHIGRTTLRRILLDAGLSSPRRRPPKHRVRRQRMPRAGMLIQMDGSYHRWLGDRSPPLTLLLAVDDATGSVVDALFCISRKTAATTSC